MNVLENYSLKSQCDLGHCFTPVTKSVSRLKLLNFSLKIFSIQSLIKHCHFVKLLFYILAQYSILKLYLLFLLYYCNR